MGRSALPVPRCGTDSSSPWEFPPIRETSLACGLLLRAAVFVGVAVAWRVGGVARRELARREVGVRRRDPLLQLLDLEARRLLLLNLLLWHRKTSFSLKRDPETEPAR